MLLWENTQQKSVSRAVIAGDFLPAGRLHLSRGTWKDVAANVAPHFSKADVGILNLECCVDVGDMQPRRKIGLGDSFSAGADVLDFPSALGARIVGMANNHIYDYGEEGVARTRRAILARDLTPVGICKTLGDSPDIALAEIANGHKLGIWAAARHLPELATRDKAGVEPATIKRGQEALSALKSRDASTTIAFLHAGLERTNRPDPDDVDLMDGLAQMGFDIVTACHSHRIAGYKEINRNDGSSAFCFYGLGSISSGVIYSELEREGLLVLAGLDESGKLARVSVKPVCLEDDGRARAAFLGDAYTTLSRFESLSQELANGMYKQGFYSEVQDGLLQRQFRDIRAAIQNGGIRGLISKLGRARMRHLQRALGKSIG
jgi:poly-gamma-glutamate capsule biosynthesis protein CapA/YwtB (metallophosphatase superfamily)